MFYLAHPSRSILRSPHFARGIHQRAEIRSDVEKVKSKIQKTGVIGMTAIVKAKIMNLSVEAKVAIAVGTGFVVLIVGAMAQG